jgi:predicted GNAT family acetyltransferase/chromosome segregation ATPase
LAEARVELKAELEKLRQEQGVKKESNSKVEEVPALKDVESASKSLEGKKASLDERAKKLGYIGVKQFNSQNQLNENLNNEEKALLQEYADFQQEIKNLEDENIIAKLSDDEFSSWSKANDIQRDELGKVVRDDDIELATKRIRILKARGDSEKADLELKKLKESKKKDNWTVESWKERFDEDIEQSEIDDINKSNKEFNQFVDKAVKDLETTKPQEDAVQVEAAGQVPVLTEAPVGEEVEQGKPQAKPKVVTEEGKEEVGSGVGGDVESTAKALEEKYGIILDLTENKNGDLSIGRIIVPKENRGKGVGKKAMQDIVDYADKMAEEYY